ncbi:polysaccharide biosynthesis/export family protein [Sphingopyxis kveilinensis]|uniref:polysaccharide biosynthesis/export family protein n=1 Tax=Sphingopyxis kveilinensis TaxID=3114367 RepID=UPI0030CCDB37
MIRRAPIALVCLTLAACAGPRSTAPAGNAAYAIIPTPVAGVLPAEYRIGPSDVLSMKVFQEPELSNDQLPVDAAGTIYVPLIGMVAAAGKTRAELAGEIAQKLDQRFLVNPQVAINVVTAVTQRVTVDGEVRKPGVFPKAGQLTLLQAIALGEGTSDVAKLNQVIVFRNIGDQRLVARFDLGAIRAGNAPDPEILGNDIVVVGESAARRIYRDAIMVLPALAGAFVTVTDGR